MNTILAGMAIRFGETENSGATVAALPEWRTTVGTALSIVAVVALLALVVVAWRGGLWTGFRSPFLALPRTQRRALVRQVTGSGPVAHDELPLVREAARFLIRQRYGSYLLIPVACSVAGNALGSGGAFEWALAGVLTGLALAGGVYTARSARLAGHFLAREPELHTV